MMSKHDILTEDEFSKFAPNLRIVRLVEEHRRRIDLPRAEFNILDWGCGRGREVLWLREHGYNAFGVDIAAEPIRNAQPLFSKRGYHSSLLCLLSEKGRTKFPDKFFHFVFSDEVFEHVRDIQSVARELRRITATNGEGYHRFPAHRRLIEAHLLMPLIHWLPKSRLRKYLIVMFVSLGWEPRWEELRNLSLLRKANAYFEYSVDKTYYRRYADVARILRENGFTVRFVALESPRMQRGVLRYLFRISLVRRIITRLFLTFRSVDLVVR